MTNEIAHPCQHGNEAVLCLQCHRDEIERLNGYVEHLVADREKQALAMTGKIERLKAELDQRNAEFREYARKTELEFRRLREALTFYATGEWKASSNGGAPEYFYGEVCIDEGKRARAALGLSDEPSVHPDPSEEAAEIARGFAKLREALIQAGWTPPDPDEHPFATEFRRLIRQHNIPRPDIRSADQWTPEERARFQAQQAQNMCPGCFRPVSACVCASMKSNPAHEEGVGCAHCGAPYATAHKAGCPASIPTMHEEPQCTCDQYCPIHG